jgi:hypothetical protein
MATAHLRHQIGRGDGRHSGYNLLNGAASALALESGSGCSMGFLSSVGEVGSGERGRNTEDRIGEAAHPGRVQLGIGSEFDLTSTPFWGVSTAVLGQMPELSHGYATALADEPTSARLEAARRTRFRRGERPRGWTCREANRLQSRESARCSRRCRSSAAKAPESWTSLRAAHIPYEVQKLLRHSRSATTQRYAHLADGSHRRATEAAARRIGHAIAG